MGVVAPCIAISQTNHYCAVIQFVYGVRLHKQYTERTRLGGGTQGETFLATDQATGRRVVQKVVRLTGGTTGVKDIELWERECETLATLDHPAIPKYLGHYSEDLSEGDREFVLVQSYEDGDDLEKVIASGRRWTEEEWVHLARQLLHILGYLHGLNPPVIHRDIKPSNIILRADGRLALVDFGGVQSVIQDSAGGSTVIGTHGYMPPEQLVGRATPASDLYGMAATLVHLASGIAPSTLPMDRMQLRFRHVVHLRQSLQDWLEKHLAPMVEDRYASAHESLEALDAALAPGATQSSARAVAAPSSARLSLRLVNRLNTLVVVCFFLFVGYYAVGNNDDRLAERNGVDGAGVQDRQSVESNLEIPAAFAGPEAFKIQPRSSHVIHTQKPYYFLLGKGVWTGPGDFAITSAFVSLLGESGDTLGRCELRITSYGAPLQSGDVFGFSTLMLNPRTGKLCSSGPQPVTNAVIQIEGQPIESKPAAQLEAMTVHGLPRNRWEGSALHEYDTVMDNLSFFVRGRSNAGPQDKVTGWVDVGVMRGPEGPPLTLLDFTVRGVSTDGSIRCGATPGYPVASAGHEFLPLESRSIRQKCPGLQPEDAIEVELRKVNFGDH